MNDADRGLAARAAAAPAASRPSGVAQRPATWQEPIRNSARQAWRGSRRDGSHQDCRALAMPTAQALISAQFRKSPSPARMAEAMAPVGEAEVLPDKPAGKDPVVPGLGALE